MMEQTRLSHPKITVLGILGSLELAPRAHWGLTGDGNRGISIHLIVLGMGSEILGKQVDFLLTA